MAAQPSGLFRLNYRIYLPQEVARQPKRWATTFPRLRRSSKTSDCRMHELCHIILRTAELPLTEDGGWLEILLSLPFDWSGDRGSSSHDLPNKKQVCEQCAQMA